MAATGFEPLLQPGKTVLLNSGALVRSATAALALLHCFWLRITYVTKTTNPLAYCWLLGCSSVKLFAGAFWSELESRGSFLKGPHSRSLSSWQVGCQSSLALPAFAAAALACLGQTRLDLFHAESPFKMLQMVYHLIPLLLFAWLLLS